MLKAPTSFRDLRIDAGSELSLRFFVFAVLNGIIRKLIKRAFFYVTAWEVATEGKSPIYTVDRIVSFEMYFQLAPTAIKPRNRRDKNEHRDFV